MSYTALAGVGAAAAVAFDLWILRTRVLGARDFWWTYLVLLGFQLIANGLLTGLRVVRYDPQTIIGVRFVYAPIEDLAFGFALITATLSCWVWAARHRTNHAPAPADASTERSSYSAQAAP